jgi:hypothetical protein
MIDKKSVRNILEFQKEFKKRLKKPFSVLNFSVPSLLHRILECDNDILSFTLGDIGLKLKEFSQHVDFQHPEITSVFNGIISDDQQLAKEFKELLVLGKYAKEKELHNIIPYLNKLITKNCLDKNIHVLKRIDSPKNNRMHVRLLKEVGERKQIRIKKRMQIIDLQSIYRKGEIVWEVQPDNFIKFLRFNNTYEEDLISTEKKAKRYEEIGCISLASEIRKSIKLFKENMEHSYYGFNRITMTNASLILAKFFNFDYLPKKDDYKSSYPKIVINSDFFGKYNFDPNVSSKNNEGFDYEPKVYPFHELEDIATDSLKKIISVLENFPDAGNKPIFDHFGVIVPSISFFSKKDEKDYSFYDKKGILKSYKTREDAIKNLDKILIKEKFFYPVVVGERDSKCYFVCYWS